MRRITFDLDVLRSFVTGTELGTFAKAADRLGRSTSAVSAQLKKLEEQAGTPIFRKAGRGLMLTEAGETMLAYARRLIDLNDEAAAAIGNLDLEGWIRLGVQGDFGELMLPEVLGGFSRAHPRVRIEATVARNAELEKHIASGRLDLALLWGDTDHNLHGERLTELPMHWIGRASGTEREWPNTSGDALPLVLSEAPCLFRSVATEALDRAGISWRVAFISPSLAGLWAATSAGLGITLRTGLGLRPGLVPLGSECGLPLPLPTVPLMLLQAESVLAPAMARLAEIIRTAVIDPGR
jgi:DNA-binding transcriptional LysR family regulator